MFRFCIILIFSVLLIGCEEYQDVTRFSGLTVVEDEQALAEGYIKVYLVYNESTLGVDVYPSAAAAIDIVDWDDVWIRSAALVVDGNGGITQVVGFMSDEERSAFITELDKREKKWRILKTKYEGIIDGGDQTVYVVQMVPLVPE